MKNLLIFITVLASIWGVTIYWGPKKIPKKTPPKKQKTEHVVKKKNLPKAWLVTHEPYSTPEKVEKGLATRGNWLRKPIHIQSQKIFWVEFEKKQLDDSVYIKCSHKRQRLKSAKIKRVNLNSMKEKYTDSSCRFFDVMIPPFSKTSSAIVVFSITRKH